MKVIYCKNCKCLTEHKRVSSECVIEDKSEKVFFTVMTCGMIQLFRNIFYKCKLCNNIIKK